MLVCVKNCMLVCVKNCMLVCVRVMVQGKRHAGRTHNYSIVRLAALEARAMKRANLVTVFYLPIIFFGYGFLLGRTHTQY